MRDLDGRLNGGKEKMYGTEEESVVRAGEERSYQLPLICMWTNRKKRWCYALRGSVFEGSRQESISMQGRHFPESFRQTAMY